jgi:hypothetical protein
MIQYLVSVSINFFLLKSYFVVIIISLPAIVLFFWEVYYESQ